jgi:hypothetical protein
MPKIILFTGAGKGADQLAEQWAHKQKIGRVELILRFHPDWDKHGPKAGPYRNEDMLACANVVKPRFYIAFWDGRSPGTKDCIARARKKGIPTTIIRYKEL